MSNYRSNGRWKFSCRYHIIWCPKYRQKVLLGVVESKLKSVIEEICRETNSLILGMEIMPDHVHLLVDLDPTFGVAELVKRLKGRSARVLRKEFPFLKTVMPCLWTRSTFVATVGSVSLETVKTYIENQPKRIQ